jgi:hypothetical protein
MIGASVDLKMLSALLVLAVDTWTKVYLSRNGAPRGNAILCLHHLSYRIRRFVPAAASYAATQVPEVTLAILISWNCRISQCCPAQVSISGRAIRLLSDILIRLPAVNQGTVRGENDHDLSIRRNFLESRAISYAGKKNSNSAKEFAGTTT